jgi:hypothetical protein
MNLGWKKDLPFFEGDVVRSCLHEPQIGLDPFGAALDSRFIVLQNGHVILFITAILSHLIISAP